MIKKMQHAYIQHGQKFYVFIEPVLSKRKIGEETRVTDADNLYIFDAKGFVWLQMTHVEIKFVLDGLGGGFLNDRTLYTIDIPSPANRKPIVESDEWIQGNFDKGYALETIKGALGLNLTYITQLMKGDSGEK